MIHFHNIWRSFGSTVAVDDVSLCIPGGRITALLGENGAGKTTLVNILFGVIRPDRGRMELDGIPYAPRGPRDALARGIGMVHQHFALVPTLTAAENIVLGVRRNPWVSQRRLNDEISRFAASVSLPIRSDARVALLSLGERQRVEILKALYRRVRVLVLDEPTAVLTAEEANGLFEAMRELRRRGVTIIFITHKLAEVVDHCDELAVLRRGRLVYSGPAGTTTPASLAELMIGRAVEAPIPLSPPAARRAPALEMRGVSLSRGSPFDLTVQQGEVVGIAGVDGNGQDELARVVSGLEAPAAGTVRIAGRGPGAARVAARSAGVVHIPSDRQRQGLALDLTLIDNAILTRHSDPAFAHFGWLRRAACADFAASIVRDFDVRTSLLRASAATLSGGNQQKFVVGRELAARPTLIVAHNPTRGVDVAAAALIRARLLDAAREGAGVLLISSDLDELVPTSHRIAVLYRGGLTVSGWPDCDLASIGRLMAGLEAA